MYNITITAANVFPDPLVIGTTDNATNKTVSDLAQGMEYSFTVAGVDAGGRVGENSAPSRTILDGKYKQGFKMSRKSFIKSIPELHFILLTSVFVYSATRSNWPEVPHCPGIYNSVLDGMHLFKITYDNYCTPYPCTMFIWFILLKCWLMLLNISVSLYELQLYSAPKLVNFSLQPPLTNPRPPVKEYKISHNTTGSVLVNQTNYTTFVLENVTPGAYLFTVLAVNILGDGQGESTVITVGKQLFN